MSETVNADDEAAIKNKCGCDLCLQGVRVTAELLALDGKISSADSGNRRPIDSDTDHDSVDVAAVVPGGDGQVVPVTDHIYEQIDEHMTGDERYDATPDMA